MYPNMYPGQGIMPNCSMMCPMASMQYWYGAHMMDDFDEESDDDDYEHHEYDDHHEHHHHHDHYDHDEDDEHRKLDDNAYDSAAQETVESSEEQNYMRGLNDEEESEESMQMPIGGRQYSSGYGKPGYGEPGYTGPQKPSPGFPGQYADPAQILRIIERNNPEIFRTMISYGIPNAEARQLVRRIIRISLRYCR